MPAAAVTAGENRYVNPTWQTEPVASATSVSSLRSATVAPPGFSTRTALPVRMARMASGAMSLLQE